MSQTPTSKRHLGFRNHSFNLHDAMEALVKGKVATGEFAFDSQTLPPPPAQETGTPEGNPGSEEHSSDLPDEDEVFKPVGSTSARDANDLTQEERDLDSDASEALIPVQSSSQKRVRGSANKSPKPNKKKKKMSGSEVTQELLSTFKGLKDSFDDSVTND